MARPEHAVELILKTYHHLRVVKTLASSDHPITKYQISKQSGINAATVAKILNELSAHDWTMKTTLKPNKYSLNVGNPVVRKFLEFLEEAKYL
ncbi:MAG: hypothetical protein NZ956_03225 [Candidatus Caldarchaeum sp.]|nr:hypothetical protein [Candidatus Caldarchaeum sp.]